MDILLHIVAEFVSLAIAPAKQGFFQGDEIASRLARGLSNQQIKKFVRHMIIPTAFYLWLREYGFLDPYSPIPKGGTDVEQLQKILYRNGFSPEQLGSYREVSRRQKLAESCKYELKQSSGTQEHLWMKIEYFKQLKHVEMPRY